ncbi:MAG TPA: branched-chain amino acid ABC transporter permease [Gaiellaceae bacterium]|nr:branched-chain amino acid ABC transporter permease [Gaiellaceae bacterium]
MRRRKRPAVLSVVGLGFVALFIVWLGYNLVNDPTNFFNIFLIGLTQGSVYALVALGYTLVYGILQLINFAHGDVFALTGLVASSLIVSTFNLDETSSALMIVGGLGATFLIAMVFGATVNATIELVAYRRLRNAPRLAVLITAVGMSFIVQNISLAFFDVNFRSVPSLVPDSDVFRIGGVHYSWQALFVVLVTAPVLVILRWLVQHTRQGKAMRATAQDPEASAMMGINVNRTISFTFLLAGALAGIGAVLFLVEFNVRYDTGFELGLIAFTAAVLGGIGNLYGAVLGALIIGMVQAFNEGPFPLATKSDWTRSLVFGILIAILVFRPEGLLGERTPEGA